MTTIAEKHAFISFSSKDEKRARAICDELERRKVPCWISSRDVRPGRNYQNEIIEAIRRATHLVLVFSNNSNQSGEVARELSLASKVKIPICPVRIENVQPSGGMEFMLATSQWVDAFDGWSDAMDRLAAEIADTTFAAKSTPAPQLGKKRALPLLFGAVAVIVAAGVIYRVTGAGHNAVISPAAQTQKSVASAMAAVDTLAKSFDCAHVSVGSPGSQVMTLSGYVQSAADEQRLLDAASGFQVQNTIDVAPYPFCAVRGLGPSLGAADDIDITINHPDAHYTIGDSLTGSFVPSGQGRQWVQAEIIQFDGSVTHVLPDPGKTMAVQAGQRVSFGAPSGQAGNIEASDPPGQLVLLVIASDKPLPSPTRAGDTARNYLPQLRDTLAKTGGTLSISTRDITVTRAPH